MFNLRNTSIFFEGRFNLVPSVPGHSLLLYLAVHEPSTSCVVGHHDETGKKEQIIYYLSKKLADYEFYYSTIEKTCFVPWCGQRRDCTIICFTILSFWISRTDPLATYLKNPRYLEE